MKIQEMKLTVNQLSDNCRFIKQLRYKFQGKYLETLVTPEESLFKNLPKTLKSPKLKRCLDQKIQYKSKEIINFPRLEEHSNSKFLRISCSKSSPQIKFYCEQLELSNKFKRIEGLIPEKMKEMIVFSKFKRLNFNADLIISHKLSFGEIYLGSNSYQYDVDNLNNFDVIINVIGEDHIKTFEGKHLTLKQTSGIQNRNIEVMTALLTNGHFVNYYLKLNDNFHDYHYLADKIHEHFLKGQRIFIHCKQGLIRSAMLLTFYLRKYIFERVEDANEFIGIKRENAGCQDMFFQTFEKMIQVARN